MSLARHRELLVLGAVQSHDIHGYALAEALARGSGIGLGVKRPTIYALLNRLLNRELVAYRTEKDPAYPERRVYRITEKGRETLAELVRASAKATVTTVVPLAVIVAHIDELHVDERTTVLEACRDEIRGALDDLTAIPSHEGLGGLAIDLVRRHLELDLKTVEELVSDAREGLG